MDVGGAAVRSDEADRHCRQAARLTDRNIARVDGGCRKVRTAVLPASDIVVHDGRVEESIVHSTSKADAHESAILL